MDKIQNEFHVPNEIKDLFILKEENQWDILEVLINNNNKLSYSKINDELRIPKGTLNHHLKKLQQAGWLRNWFEVGTKVSDRENSYYEISKFALKVLEGSMQAMRKSSYTTDSIKMIKDEFIINKSDVLETYRKILHHIVFETSMKQEQAFQIMSNPQEVKKPNKIELTV